MGFLTTLGILKVNSQVKNKEIENCLILKYAEFIGKFDLHVFVTLECK